MQPHTRRAIAYITGRVIGRKTSSLLYDYEMSQYFNFSGTIGNTSCNIYDASKQAYVSGSYFNLFHHGNAKYINLKIESNNFSGYDYDTSSFYQGEINEAFIRIYDHQTSQYYNYYLGQL